MSPKAAASGPPIVNSRLLGAAAEHFIMCELLRRNYIAALAPAGVPEVDIVVSDRNAKHLSNIQVKARRELGTDGGWHMKAKHERIVRSSLFYCFVDFRTNFDTPECWIIPSDVVASNIRRSYDVWMATPGKGGKPHTATEMRRLLPDYKQPELPDLVKGWMDKYRDAWWLIPQSNSN